MAARSGALRAVVGADPSSLVLRSGRHTVLAQHPATGAGPSGTLGFRTATGWSHATRMLRAERVDGRYEATLATTDAGRTIAIRFSPGREGVIRLDAELIGSGTGVEAMGIGFRARPGERYAGHRLGL